MQKTVLLEMESASPAAEECEFSNSLSPSLQALLQQILELKRFQEKQRERFQDRNMQRVDSSYDSLMSSEDGSGECCAQAHSAGETSSEIQPQNCSYDAVSDGSGTSEGLNMVPQVQCSKTVKDGVTEKSVSVAEVVHITTCTEEKTSAVATAPDLDPNCAEAAASDSSREFVNEIDSLPVSGTEKSFSEILAKSIEMGYPPPGLGMNPVPKREFLKRGTGLLRYTSDSKSGIKKKVTHDDTSGPTNVSDENLVGDRCAHNKLALGESRVKFPFLKKGARKPISVYMKRQTRSDRTKIAKVVDDVTSEKKCDASRSPVEISRMNLLPIKRLTLERRETTTIVQQDSTAKLETAAANNYKLNQSSVVLDENNIIEKQHRKEIEELSAYEKLEELVEDSSFSSNSSTIHRLLQRGLNSASSTPVQVMSPVSPLEVSDRHMEKVPSCVNLMGRLQETVDGSSYPSNKDSFHTKPVMNLKQVIQQLQGIVQLEDSESLSFTPEQLENFLNGSNISHSPSNSVMFSEHSHPERATSTPADVTAQQPSNPPQTRVHFPALGAEVLEYQVSDSDDTLTNASSINDTDLVSITDLEALTAYNIGISPLSSGVPGELTATVSESSQSSSCHPCGKHSDVAFETASVNGDDCRLPKNVLLQFSPPHQPKNSASHLIWSVFAKGKSKTNKKQLNCVNYDTSSASKQETPSEVKSSKPKVEDAEKDFESHKVLLLSKLYELEQEIKSHHAARLRVEAIQTELNAEKKCFMLEKRKQEKQLEEEREKFRKCVDQERKNIWKEKLEATRASYAVSPECREDVVMLREQLACLQEELQKKESLHSFALKRNNEKIKKLEEENKQLKEKVESLQRLGKENLKLQHQLDRTRFRGKSAPPFKSTSTKTGEFKVSKNGKGLNSVGQNLSVRDNSDKDEVGDVSIQNVYPSRKLSLGKSMSIPGKIRATKTEKATNKVKFHSLPSYSRECELAQIETDLVKDRNSHDCDDQGSIEMCVNKDTFEECGVHDTAEQDHHVTCNSQSQKEIEEASNVNHSKGLSTEVSQPDGTKEIIFDNGNKKKVFQDGHTVWHFFNGDIKEVYRDKVVYTYGADKTKHVDYSDGRAVYEYASGHHEIHFPDGSCKITFPDSSHKTISNTGEEVSVFKNGIIVRADPSGIKVFEYPNGQREIHSAIEMRREYPDGTVKILYPDGRQETRYKTGRVRLKDKEGNLVFDTHS